MDQIDFSKSSCYYYRNHPKSDIPRNAAIHELNFYSDVIGANDEDSYNEFYVPYRQEMDASARRFHDVGWNRRFTDMDVSHYMEADGFFDDIGCCEEIGFKI